MQNYPVGILLCHAFCRHSIVLLLEKDIQKAKRFVTGSIAVCEVVIDAIQNRFALPLRTGQNWISDVTNASNAHIEQFDLGAGELSWDHA